MPSHKRDNSPSHEEPLVGLGAPGDFLERTVIKNTTFQILDPTEYGIVADEARSAAYDSRCCLN